ncbi:MAG TPA: isochorismatase family protein [Thermomicrobiales bacterium]|nr:isochorismatase family protein [Thermomicrobiales bacterium]
MLRHPLTLLTREVPPLELRPGATWLLLQDVHAPFADPEQGALAREAGRKVVLREFDDYFDAMRLIADNLARLVETARRVGLGVVYSCLGHEPGASPSAFQLATGWRWDLAGPDGAFPAGWRPQDGEPIFAKPGWGALGNPAFARFLAEQRVETMLVAGAMFEFGIRQTCGELADRGVGTLVLADAVVPLTSQAQGPAAGAMAHGLTKLRSTAETLDLLAIMARDGVVLV